MKQFHFLQKMPRKLVDLHNPSVLPSLSPHSPPEPAHPSLVWEQLTGAMSCPHPVPLPGWWHHLSPWGGTLSALRDKEQHLLSAHPTPSQVTALAGDCSLYFINAQTSALEMSECWDLLEGGDNQN